MAPSLLWQLVVVAVAAIVILGILALVFRWYLTRRIPAESHARRPMTRIGILHACSYVVCLLVGIVFVAVFPNGWLAQLLELVGAFPFAIVVSLPAVALGVLLETRGVKFHENIGDDA